MATLSAIEVGFKEEMRGIEYWEGRMGEITETSLLWYSLLKKKKKKET